MKDRAALNFLMSKKNWWIPLLLIFVVSLAGVIMIGVQTYEDAPPMPDFVDERGNVIVTEQDIVAGQIVFHRYALMDYGSMFGDGAGKGPDFTAEALHHTSLAMHDFYAAEAEGESDDEWRSDAIRARVAQELKENRYDEGTNRVVLSEAGVFAMDSIRRYYTTLYLSPEEKTFPPEGYITDSTELANLSAFFYWGAWVCAVERPGESYSYTHNWPYDPTAGNVPTAPTTFWSVIGLLGLIVGLGLVLYFYGQFDQLSDETFRSDATPVLTGESVAAFRPTPTQRATFKYFYVAMILFLVQVLCGALTINEFVDYLGVVGIDLSAALPITISRSWHLQLSLYWIATCWIAASIFVLPMISGKERKGQLRLINILFWLLIVMVGGSLVGILAGPKGMLGDLWYWLGHQGWEFIEFGKIYQVMLLIGFALWAFIVYRGVKPVLKKKMRWELPNWLVYSTISIVGLLLSGFIATPETSFVIADFWRWCVIHMWVEAFFEVFTTIIVGYFMVLMGLVSRQSVVRVVYLATLLFLGSGLLGISHNFYWNAKPVATMALGSVFSTLQVVPLILLTLEAWRFRRMPSLINGGEEKGILSKSFGLPGVFLFLVGVNFWNFFGAGVFGLIINLPIVNYYEHGTYLTVNHGHAALMGVYGNLSVAALLFCCRLLFKDNRWSQKLVNLSFWSLNGGLILMVALDLFPAGVAQLAASMEHGLWFARSAEFITGSTFTTLTWMRGIGGTIFIVGGILPLVWLVITRARAVKSATTTVNDTPA